MGLRFQPGPRITDRMEGHCVGANLPDVSGSVGVDVVAIDNIGDGWYVAQKGCKRANDIAILIKRNAVGSRRHRKDDNVTRL